MLSLVFLTCKTKEIKENEDWGITTRVDIPENGGITEVYIASSWIELEPDTNYALMGEFYMMDNTPLVNVKWAVKLETMGEMCFFGAGEVFGTRTIEGQDFFGVNLGCRRTSKPDGEQFYPTQWIDTTAHSALEQWVVPTENGKTGTMMAISGPLRFRPFKAKDGTERLGVSCSKRILGFTNPRMGKENGGGKKKKKAKSNKLVNEVF